MYVVGCHGMEAGIQREAYCSKLSGESQNPRIRMLRLGEMARSRSSLSRQGRAWCFYPKWCISGRELSPKAAGWVCDLTVSRAWQGLRVTATSFCCLEGSGDASGWGQGGSSQAPGGGGRVTQDCGKNVGYPLTSREGLWQSFFFLRF